MRICDFSKKEQEVLRRELTERIKDLIYMNLEEKVDNDIIKGLSKIDFRSSGTDELEIKYACKFIFNDILQIVGRVRRKIK